MRIAWAVFIVLLVGRLIAWMRDGEAYPLVQVAPLIGGFDPGIYDLAGFAMLLVGIWGFGRMRRDRDD